MNPPSGSSVLFGAVADSGKIRRRRNDTYRINLDGIDEIKWFTDRPLRVDGSWSPGKFARNWDAMYDSANPNAQASFTTDDGSRQLVTFEMQAPHWHERKQRMSFGIKPIGKASRDLITGLTSRQLGDASIFIDTYVPASNGLSVEYSVELDMLNITFNIDNPGPDGWASFVFGEFLFPSDGIYISWDESGNVNAYDTYNPGIPTLPAFPAPYADNSPLVKITNGTPADNVMNVELISSLRQGSSLIVEVQRPLQTGDLLDLQFESGEQHRAFVASGSGSMDPYQGGGLSIPPSFAQDPTAGGTKFEMII